MPLITRKIHIPKVHKTKKKLLGIITRKTITHKISTAQHMGHPIELLKTIILEIHLKNRENRKDLNTETYMTTRVVTVEKSVRQHRHIIALRYNLLLTAKSLSIDAGTAQLWQMPIAAHRKQ